MEQNKNASRGTVLRRFRVAAVSTVAGLLVIWGVSIHRPDLILHPAIQAPAKPVGGQSERQQASETVGDALEPPSEGKELGRVAAPSDGTATLSAIQSASQSFNGQLETRRPAEVSGEASDEREQQTKLGRIDSATTDQVTLRSYLRDADPIIAASAFGALRVRDKQAAVEALLDVVNDPTEPVRLQALQILLASPNVDKATLDLRDAFDDVDPAFVASAAQELGGRNDVEALNTLADVLRTGDAPARLLVVQSIADNTSAAYLLYQSLNDPDETVRNAAWAILFPPK